MTEVFKWKPVAQPTGTDSFSITSVQFGDGYQQNYKNGINNRVQNWSLEFAGDHVLDIRDFILRHEGWRSFEWTNPFGEKGFYVVREMPSKHHGNRTVSLTCKFEQVFYP